MDPSDEQEIAIFPDCSHLLKNMRNGLLKHDFVISKAIQEKYNLPSRIISRQHIYFLKEYQDKNTWKITPKLTNACFPKGNYEKMKVGPAMNFFSEDTAAGLRFLVKECGYTPEALTTAFFFDVVAKWYKFVSSRNSYMAFHKTLDETHLHMEQFLQDFTEIIDSLTFMSNKGDEQKPIQTGIKLHTKSLFTLQNYYINKLQFDYLLPGRLGSDCIENYFSQVRAKNPSPTPMQFLRAFKALLIMHHMKPSKYGSYMEDVGSHWLTELRDLKECQLETLDEDQDENVYEILVGDNVNKEFTQECALVHVAGYVLKKTIHTRSKCEKCQEFFTQSSPTLDLHKLVKEKEYKEGALTLPTEVAWRVFSFAESSFNMNIEALKKGQIIPGDLVDKLYDTVKDIPEIPHCHLKLILRRFLNVRSHFWARQMDLEEKEKKNLEQKAAAASKTMGGYYQKGYSSK